MKYVSVGIAIVFLLALAVHAEGQRLYWNSNGGAIVTASADGSDLSVFRSEAVHGIAIDAVGGRIYWNNPVENSLRSGRLDGSDIQTLVPNAGSGDIALDIPNSKIYWNSNGGGIVRANLDGSQVETFLAVPVAGLAIDPLTQCLYWNNPVENTLCRIDLGGGSPQTVLEAVGTGDIAIDQLHGKVYWNSSGGAIARANLDGSNSELFMSTHVHGIAIDPLQNRIFWNDPLYNTLNAAFLDGTNSHTVLSGVGTGALAIDIPIVPEPATAVLFAVALSTFLLRRPPAWNIM